MNHFVLFFAIVIAAFTCLIGVLKKVQFNQPIFELSPASHQAKKNIPTMGGIGILFGILLTLFFMPHIDARILWLTGLIAAFACIGLIDDGLSISKAQNKGLSVLGKLGLQFAMAAGFVGAFSVYISPLTIAVAIFYVLVIVGGTNATNLTDGLDGLLGGLAVITCLGFLVVLHSDHVLTHWLIFLILTLLAYLAFNGHPAKIFMGDTGSLMLGAAFTGLAILHGNVWVLLSLGAVYILETLSVILQVAGYKWKKKRLFLMAPLHHHFELLGLTETQVVGLFWGMGLIISWIGLALL